MFLIHFRAIKKIMENFIRPVQDFIALVGLIFVLIVETMGYGQISLREIF